MEATMETNELSLTNSTYEAVATAAAVPLELTDEPLGVAEESDYHRVARGCPKGYTQQCGIGYRT